MALAMQGLLSAYEAERMIERLARTSMADVGSARFLEQHEWLQKLNLQARHAQPCTLLLAPAWLHACTQPVGLAMCHHVLAPDTPPPPRLACLPHRRRTTMHRPTPMSSLWSSSSPTTS
jgi:hypothetical protein